MALHSVPLLLADELFLLAHDDVSGRPRLQPRATGLGLAGALLGELLLFGSITTREGTVVVLNLAPPADALAHRILDHITREQQRHPVRTWLAFFAQHAADHVAERLERTNVVTRVNSRRPWAGPRWPPTDMNVGFAPLFRLRTQLFLHEPLTTDDIILVGLCTAAGLANLLLLDSPPHTRQYLDYVISTLDPAARELIAHTRAAVDNAVLTHRM